uniref:EF-hand domain-containing protein n=1 Tax=Neobodo designis TaxID=312471 RepID=A0A7S1L8V1_NEODS|mmetsp:Transcript_17121/g.53134  ORF Transcript_17121/g.53134 Transcript_17121/m.53134 type:complete len:613 (+) Transcript_17121:88-1926(+)
MQQVVAAAGNLGAAVTTNVTVPSETFLEKIFIDVAALPNDGYGFCQLAFLGVAYAYVLMQGANLIKDGSEMLLLIPSWSGIVGSIVLPVLGAVPDGAIVLFSGMGPDAQQQLGVGMGALAGSTIMLLTVPWMLSVWAGRVNLDSDGRGNYVRPRGAGSEWSKLTPGKIRGTGVNVGPSIIHAAIVMGVTLIPFFVIQIPSMAVGKCSTKHQDDDNECKTPRVAAIIAGVMTILLFFFYLYDQKRQADNDDDVVTEGKTDRQRKMALDSGLMSLKGIFAQHQSSVVHDLQASPSTGEYMKLQEDPAAMTGAQLADPKFRRFLKPYFKKFDHDQSGGIEKSELKLLLESLGEKPTVQEVDSIFAQIDTDNSGSINFDEFVVAMQRVLAAVAAGDDNPFALSSAVATSETVNDTNTEVSRTENDDGVAAADDDEDEEEEEMPEDLAHLSPEEQQKRILQRSFMLMGLGTVIVVLFSDPMVGVLSKLGTMTHIPPFYVSFVLAPLVSNGSELIAAYAYAGKKTEKSMTIALATLVGSSAMNNTFCLAIFLFLVAGKNLKWVFTAEVTSIVLVEVAMLALIFVCRTTYKTWTAAVVIALYPVSLLIVWFMENVAGLD